MKRPLIFFLGALVLGEFIAGWELHILCVLFCLPALFFMFSHHRCSCVICILFALLGFLRMRQITAEYTQMEDIVKETVIVAEGTVRYYSETAYGWKIVLKNVKIAEKGGIPCDMTVRTAEFSVENKPDIRPGARLRCEAAVRPLERSRNDGNFDEKSYYHSKGIAFHGKLIRTVSCNQKGSALAYQLLEWKEAAKRALLSVYGERTARFYSGILFGDVSLIDSEQKELFYNQGIGHILAISGLHISILGRSLYRMFRRRFAFAPSFAVVSLFLVGFGYVTGSSVSAVRALLLLIIWMGADMAGRTYDFVSALSASALLLLVDNPYCLYSAAFQLSFGCMILIGIVIPVFCRYLGFKRRLERTVASSILLSVLLMPITARIFFVCPMYAGVLNLLVIPCMTVVLLSGILAVATAPILPALSVFFAGPGYFCLIFYESICNVADKLPFARVVTGKPSILRVCVLYGCAALSVWLCGRVKAGGSCFVRRLLFLACAIGFFFAVRPEAGHMLSVYHLDVGQGDCCVISERDGITVVVDAGSGSVHKVGERRIIPFLQAKRIRTLDYVVLSHSDEDHINAVEELLEEKTIAIGELWVYLDQDDEAMVSLVKSAQSKGIYVHRIKTGDRIAGRRASFEVLWPIGEKKISNQNEASVVLLFQYGNYTELFTGDSGAQAEQYLISSGLCPNLTCLKAAHHGSKYSSASAFLEVVSPSVAVISAGIANRYGHPHPEMLERLDAVGCTYYETAKYGCIALYPDYESQDLTVKPYLLDRFSEELR